MCTQPSRAGQAAGATQLNSAHGYWALTILAVPGPLLVGTHPDAPRLVRATLEAVDDQSSSASCPCLFPGRGARGGDAHL